MLSPCKGCCIRQVNCHSTCKYYAEFDNAKKEERKSKEAKSIIDSYMIEKKSMHESITRIPKKF